MHDAQIFDEGFNWTSPIKLWKNTFRNKATLKVYYNVEVLVEEEGVLVSLGTRYEFMATECLDWTSLHMKSKRVTIWFNIEFSVRKT